MKNEKSKIEECQYFIDGIFAYLENGDIYNQDAITQEIIKKDLAIQLFDINNK